MASATHPHRDGLRRAKSLAIPGQCIFCEEPTRKLTARATKSYALICLKRECFLAYQRAWRRDNPDRRGRAERRAKVTLWHCGCAKVVAAKGWGRHRAACLFSRVAWPEAVAA